MLHSLSRPTHGSLRGRKGPGGLPGLQNRVGVGDPGAGGFDSHAPSPSFSNAPGLAGLELVVVPPQVAQQLLRLNDGLVGEPGQALAPLGLEQHIDDDGDRRYQPGKR